MPSDSNKTADLVALHDLYGRLAHAFDSGSGERFAELCTSDIEYRGDGAIVSSGRSQIVELVHSVATTQPGLRHLISSVYVEVGENDAVGHAYAMALRPTGDGLVFGALAEYEDAFVPTERGWALRRRDFVRLAPAAANKPFVMAML